MARQKRAFIPDTVQGIQYNTCKNPVCANYGRLHTDIRDGEPAPYSLQYAGKGMPLLKCNCCGEAPPVKSNRGIKDELDRMADFLLEPIPSCPDTGCVNHTVAVGTAKAYRGYGTTAQGAPRYRCNGCGKTFSLPKATQYQHETHQNADIFKMLMNKVPLSRIVNILGISWTVLYHRIDFIHRQCVRFAANRERKLADMDIERLYISVDRQDHTVNWTERKDKRNVVITAITSVDNRTGYVFGVHPNFDGTVSRDEVDQWAKKTGDDQLPLPLRQTARFWIGADYEQSDKRNRVRRLLGGSGDLDQDIQLAYDLAQGREDIECFDYKSAEEKLPDIGIQIHAEYTMIAHFYYLKALMGKVKKWRFFLDQESGIRAAMLTAFQDEVKAHTAEGFYVRISKDITVDEKRKLTNDAKRRFAQLKDNFPGMTDEEVKLELLKEAIAQVRMLGNWKDRWVHSPLPDMSEPEKAMCWLTEHDGFDEDHTAWLYNKASLHGVDSFFQKVRRRISLLERPMSSAANRGRVWNGYASYNPIQVCKMLDIFRVVHNYIDTRKEKDKTLTTPAMRLGLAKAPVDYKTVLYFE